VKIDIHKMLLLNRRDAVTERLVPRSERLGWKAWKLGMLKRKLMDFLSGKSKNRVLNTFFKKSWGSHRAMPKVEVKSFSKQWEENNGA
jgi:L-lactate dehydrogenase complex protein LldF